MFHHISKHLEVRQKYSAARRIFNSLLGVWKCDEKRCLVFDILLEVDDDDDDDDDTDDDTDDDDGDNLNSFQNFHGQYLHSKQVPNHDGMLEGQSI